MSTDRIELKSESVVQSDSEHEHDHEHEHEHTEHSEHGHEHTDHGEHLEALDAGRPRKVTCLKR